MFFFSILSYKHDQIVFLILFIIVPSCLVCGFWTTRLAAVAGGAASGGGCIAVLPVILHIHERFTLPHFRGKKLADFFVVSSADF